MITIRLPEDYRFNSAFQRLARQDFQKCTGILKNVYIQFILFILTGLLLSEVSFGQCNQQLVEIAAEQAGADAIYIRDFKVKLSKGNMDNPNPTGKFPVYLNKGVNYRFTIANAMEYPGKAIIEVSRRSQKYAGNFNFETSEYLHSFDFECNRSSTYQVFLNFNNGKEGCAAIVMSMVYNDSMTFTKPGFHASTDSLSKLYMWTKNRFQIASSGSRTATFEVKVSQGTVSKEGRYYSIEPEAEGELQVIVKVLEDNRLIETDTMNYRVEKPLLPEIILPGQIGSSIYLKDVFTSDRIELRTITGDRIQPYKLKEFYLSLDQSGFRSEVSNGGQISGKQLQLIRKLKANDKLYISKAVFIDPDGSMHKAQTVEIFVFE